ncbi:class II aldolase/adducin family protein [archaeon]|nr:MAG: class II aldolase/adducin family protein [archaeon]
MAGRAIKPLNVFFRRALSSTTASSGAQPTIPGNLPTPPTFTNINDERRYKKQVLAASFRLFSKLGYDEGAAGHITFRDPEHPETFWVNPFGVDFSQIKVSNLIRCNKDGEVVEGKHPVNRAAFAIHSKIHLARSDVLAAAHSHSMYGKTWSVLGRKLDPITQDSCAFYDDHAVYNDYGGVVFELDEGQRIAQALGSKKAVILQNHGLLTVGKQSLEECVWWFISMEKCCKVQLLVEAASRGQPLNMISHTAAQQAYQVIGTPFAGWFQFNMLFERIKREQPDLLD